MAIECLISILFLSTSSEYLSLANHTVTKTVKQMAKKLLIYYITVFSFRFSVQVIPPGYGNANNVLIL
jgi:hypothetical protein